MKKYILSLAIILATFVYFDKINNCYGGNFKKSPKIGDSYQGGIVAYILQPTDPGYDEKVLHGLIAAPTDQSNGIQWYNGNYTLLGTGTDLGTGQSNTTAIIANQGEGNYAAKLCADLVLGDYSDWYLPSKNELNLLFLNKVKIGGFNNDGTYWSSSEDKKVFYAWREGFYSGSQVSSNKNVAYAVRAVRTF